MTSLERTIAEILGVILVISGFALWERHKGAVSCENHDKASVASQEAHNAAIAKSQAQTINEEAKARAEALAAALDPTPVLSCVRYYTPRALPKAPAAEPRSHAAPARPATVGSSFDPAPDIGRVGQAADAQIAELQDYITKICLK